MNKISIRKERPEDFASIHDITMRAFAPMAYSQGNEQDMIRALRASGGLTLSLVAAQDSKIVGHVAFTTAFAKDGSEGWYALGPISVEPALQRDGVGKSLIENGLAQLRALEAAGCILVGDPAYYGRFGFRPFPQFTPENEPAEYFMILPMRVAEPSAPMRFHPAFYE